MFPLGVTNTALRVGELSLEARPNSSLSCFLHSTQAGSKPTEDVSTLVSKVSSDLRSVKTGHTRELQSLESEDISHT